MTTSEAEPAADGRMASRTTNTAARPSTSDQPVEMAAEPEVGELPLTKFEVYGQEMLDKVVKRSGNSGRVYLPPDWVGKHTKIIRVD